MTVESDVADLQRRVTALEARNVPPPPPPPPPPPTYPADVLDLRNWKLTLPVGAAGKPTEVLQPALRTASHSRWFHTSTAGAGVLFAAPVNGVTTSGSKNPRSELREMTASGGQAAWSSTSGTHTLRVVEAFTRLPDGKPHVVGAQIHDAANDITVFRCEGSSLYVTKGNDPHYKLVTSTYTLGTPFEAKFVVSGGIVRAYFNGNLVAAIAQRFTGAYFKAGCYTQANPSNIAANLVSTDNYGEVEVFELAVSHA